MIVRCLFLLIVLIPTFIFGQARVERPWQVHANFSGAFLKIAASGIADETVDDIKVDKWLPGFSVGYHFNRYLYVGYTFFSPLELTLKESWALSPGPLDGDIVLKHEPGAMHSLDVRFSPFKFGLHVSAAIANIGAVDYDMTFRRKSSLMRIGANSYATDLDISWNSERITRLALGLGYTFVNSRGISFDLGLNVPLGFPDDEKISFTPVNNSGGQIASQDLVASEQVIQNETFYGPIMFFINLGYNFKLN